MKRVAVIAVAVLLSSCVAGIKYTAEGTKKALGPPCASKETEGVVQVLYCLGPDQRVATCKKDLADCDGLVMMIFEVGKVTPKPPVFQVGKPAPKSPAAK